MHSPKRSGGDRRQTDRRKGGSTFSGKDRRKGPIRKSERRKKAQDADIAKGAVESERPGGREHVSMAGQLPHRGVDDRIKGQDTDFPEPGQSPEHSGQQTNPGR